MTNNNFTLLHSWENLEKIKEQTKDRKSIIVFNQNQVFIYQTEDSNYWKTNFTIETDYQNMSAINLKGETNQLFVNYKIDFGYINIKLSNYLSSSILLKCGTSATSGNSSNFILREQPFFRESTVYEIEGNNEKIQNTVVHRSLHLVRAYSQVLYEPIKYSEPSLPAFQSKLLLQFFNPGTTI